MSLNFQDWKNIQYQTFSFFRTDFKNIAILFLIIIIPSCLPSLWANWLYPFPPAHHYKPTMFYMFARYKDTGFRTVVGIILGCIKSTSIVLITSSLIKFYNEQKRTSELSVVCSYFFSRYIRVFYTTLILLVIMDIGFFLLVIPGVYLIPVIGIATILVSFENYTNPLQTLIKGLEMIKNSWFFVFIICLLPTLLVFGSMLYVRYLSNTVWVGYGQQNGRLLSLIINNIIGAVIIFIGKVNLVFTYLALKKTVSVNNAAYNILPSKE